MQSKDDMEPHQRLAQARSQAGFATASDAARAFGWNENTYRSHENGERGLRIDVAKKYAKAFKITENWLLFGTAKGYLRFESRTALRGKINDDGVFEDYDVKNKIEDYNIIADSVMIAVSRGWPAEVISQRPVLSCYPGDLIIVSNTNSHPEECIGKLCLIDIEDGTMILRRFRFGSEKHHVDLQIYQDMPPIISRYTDIYPVIAVIQSGFWTRSTLAEFKDRAAKWRDERE